jgi:hypothetical protein
MPEDQGEETTPPGDYLAGACGICTLELKEEPTDEERWASISIIKMQCCSSFVHLHCVYQIISLRAIRKNCCICQEPISGDFENFVAASFKEQKVAAEANLRAIEAFLREQPKK